MQRAEPHTRAIVEPQPSSWLLLLRYLQTLATPDTLQAILTHPPAGSLKQLPDPAVAAKAVVAGKLDDQRVSATSSSRRIAR
jgi:hypothetical protein